METERTQFEAAMWTYYLDLKAKGWSAPGEGDPTPEALFWREESGKYGVLSVEAAWNGWQMARKSEVPAPAACAETLIFEDYPEFHAEGMGCGLEDRNITDRYEAMRYGWDEALEAVGLNITGFLSDLPQAAPVAQLSEPPDPLQGAANWLLKALKDCTTADLQRNLLIGYNRAHRLLFAAQEAAAPTTFSR